MPETMYMSSDQSRRYLAKLQKRLTTLEKNLRRENTC